MTTEELLPKAPGAVRIVTWNVAAGFADKVGHLTNDLAADVDVVCEACNEGRLRKAGVSDYRSMDWVGRIQTRGLAVVPADWDLTQGWVGGSEDWLRKGDGSDHAPLVVDVVPK